MAAGCKLILARFARTRWRPRPGFSLVELMMMIGVTAVLIGLLLPSLDGAITAARRTRSAAAVQQDHQLMSVFLRDNRDRYPVAGENVFDSAKYWWRPLVEKGYAASPEDLDPSITPGEEITIALSCAAVMDHAQMTPDTARPTYTTPPTPVRAEQMMFPSEKALLWKWWVNYGPVHGLWG